MAPVVLFVSDIDDTLRPGDAWDRGARAVAEGPPLPGAPALLWAVHRRGVPIVYLTAARSDARRLNAAFLRRHFPPGRLIDCPRAWQRRRTAFKRHVLRRLARAHPGATLVCLGDDAHADPQVYRACRCHRGGFIRRAAVPSRPAAAAAAAAGFDRYADVHGRVLADVDALLLRRRRRRPPPPPAGRAPRGRPPPGR